MTRQELGLDQGETRATRLLQPSPYSGRGSAEALALAGQSGALWREVKRLSAELQEVTRERDELREAARALLDALPFDANSCVGRRHEHMVVATKSCRFAPPYAGSWYACDECAADPPADLPTAEATDRRIAAPLRTLRAILEGGSQ